MPSFSRTVPIITDPARLPAPIRDHLELRLGSDERKLTPLERRQLDWWISTRPHAPAGKDWSRDFGTFYTVGRGEFWKSILTSKKDPKTGMMVRMSPHKKDVRLAALDSWMEEYLPWQK
jgi:hypothetical protein